MNSDKKKDAKKTVKKEQKVIDVNLEELETIVRDAQEAKQKAEEKGTIAEILREADEESGQTEDELRKKTPAFLYTIPSFHNPGGQTLSAPRRRNPERAVAPNINLS